MEKIFNPEEISSTLDVESFEPTAPGASRSRSQIPADSETTKTTSAKAKAQNDNETTVEDEKLVSPAKRDRKLPDWMIKAGQEKSKAVSIKSPDTKNRRNERDNDGSTKKSRQTKPDDIYIMSDEDLLDVARYFIKHK